MVEKEDGLHFLCWEGKYLSKMCAFNFGMVQPHQHAYLMEYSKAMGVEAYLVVGVKFARGKNFIYVFDYKDVNILFIKRKSIHSKFLMKLPYMQVHKNKIEFDLSNVITLDKLKEVYGEKEWQKLLSDA